MDLFDVGRSCLRRWYLLIPMLLVVGWYGYSAYSSVVPVYYANTVIGLAPPNSRVEYVDAGVPLPRNGLLDEGGATLIANMTQIGLQKQSVVDKVVAAGGLPDYYAKMLAVPPGIPQPPLIQVEITSAKQEAVTRTLELVIEEAEDTLKSLQQQAHVPEDQMVHTLLISPPTAPAEVMPSRTKSTLTILIAGSGLAVLVTVLADVLLSHLKSRLQRRRQSKLAAAEMSRPADLPTEDHQPVNSAPVDQAVMENT
ncbi:hypothetical protein CQY20_00910 [Mycolicibacterium agri]|uniref:Chain-length determining protein n=1 Tax=Mycolicibacterium agri TaxID=36811 RepID=A0A2A7NHI6_MYCAG|nr:hypothetical protein [Mycolicibacterium agri]PEG43177.1 hypothetical protein CQY20_00910 [Mycolicibacterium agri]GFG54418.1 hypothetical protein MAGR_58590 [Mycolicibacterium agri]